MSECEVPNQLRAGTFLNGPIEVQQHKFNPSKIGGWKPNEGDTHGDQILTVPDCEE